jgi:hypothetical protein
MRDTAAFRPNVARTMSRHGSKNMSRADTRLQSARSSWSKNSASSPHAWRREALLGVKPSRSVLARAAGVDPVVLRNAGKVCRLATD